MTAVVSLAGLLTGAALATIGALYRADALVNIGATIIGGALGMFVPQAGLRGGQSRRATAPGGIIVEPRTGRGPVSLSSKS
jgi:hypothetical protein